MRRQEAMELTSTLKHMVVALVAAGALFAPAYALATPAQVGYSTTLQATDPATKIAYYFGTLRLSVSDQGIIHGWYQAQYDGTYTPVTGSYKSGKYWLTIGNGEFQVFATKMRDGTLAGTATDTAITQNQTLFSTTTLAPTASNNLYPQTFNFYAKPSTV
jgi:hypothetical protein